MSRATPPMRLIARVPDLEARHGLAIEIICNDRFDRNNAYSLWLAATRTPAVRSSSTATPCIRSRSNRHFSPPPRPHRQS